MRGLRFAEVAVRAEILLLRRQAALAAQRGIFAFVAVVFGLAALVLAHLIGVLALEKYAHLNPITAIAVVMAVDLVCAALAAWCAGRPIDDPVAREALQLRDSSLAQARASFGFAALFRVVLESGLIRLLLRALVRRK